MHESNRGNRGFRRRQGQPDYADRVPISIRKPDDVSRFSATATMACAKRKSPKELPTGTCAFVIVFKIVRI